MKKPILFSLMAIPLGCSSERTYLSTEDEVIGILRSTDEYSNIPLLSVTLADGTTQRSTDLNFLGVVESTSFIKFAGKDVTLVKLQNCPENITHLDYEHGFPLKGKIDVPIGANVYIQFVYRDRDDFTNDIIYVTWDTIVFHKLLLISG